MVMSTNVVMTTNIVTTSSSVIPRTTAVVITTSNLVPVPSGDAVSCLTFLILLLIVNGFSRVVAVV